MKILSGPEGDGLLTNAEVSAWLKEKNFEVDKRDLKEGSIRPPSSTATLAKDLREYLESSPSGNEKVESVRNLFTRLEKFKLSSPELMMIANIRPEAYAHLTPLLVDVYSRFGEDQLYEMLEVINATLEKRKKVGDSQDEGKVKVPETEDKFPDAGQRAQNGANLEDGSKQAYGAENNASLETAAKSSKEPFANAMPVGRDATMIDITSMAAALPAEADISAAEGNKDIATAPATVPAGRDATMIDYTTVVATQPPAQNVAGAQGEDAHVSAPRDATLVDISAYMAAKKSP